MKILDCTFRDGGYYTNWDFDSNLVDTYINAMNKLPIDYLELGYRNNPSSDYLGKLGYSPLFFIDKIRAISQKKLALMLNEKSVSSNDLKHLIAPIKGKIDMIRIAVDPKNFNRALHLAADIKNYGFEVGFNMMYMSKWHEISDFFKHLNNVDSVADLFCMVDSFGGITPDVVRETLKKVKENTSVSIGFHGHNNLELGLINSITAIENGADFVDATILGMGRGAGNLKMELLLSYLNKFNGLEVDFNILGELVAKFQKLYDRYKWGSTLPYMISGANSLPQKDVMEWVSNRAYSFNSIIRALDNKRNNVADNAKYPIFKPNIYDTVIVIGGGSSAIKHFEGIKNFILSNKNIALVFATARNADIYQILDCDKYYVASGSEGKRIAKNVPSLSKGDCCILAPFPRKMGTDVPDMAKDRTYELKEWTLCDGSLQDSCTAVALQTVLNLNPRNIYMVGYDGYPGEVLSEKEVALTNENRQLFKMYNNLTGKSIISLTPTLYRELDVKSVYQFI